MQTVEIVTTTKIRLDVETVAKWFSGLSDEQQADFFIEVAKLAQAWPGHGNDQWWFVGRHLRTCSCSTDEAREMVRSLHSGLTHKPVLTAAND